jgi:hypothetical protein
MKNMLVPEESKYIMLHSASDAKMYVRGIKFWLCKDVQMMRNKLMTCFCHSYTVDIVQGNVPVLCKLFIGDRDNSVIQFTLEDVNNPKRALNDAFVYASTESKTPSDKDFMKMFIN